MDMSVAAGVLASSFVGATAPGRFAEVVVVPAVLRTRGFFPPWRRESPSGVVAERFRRRGLRRLSEPEGFPQMPVSHLVVDRRASETSPIAQAMTAAIVSTFQKSSRAATLP